MKTYLASSVFVRVPKDERSANGNTQRTILVRCRNMKRAAELVGCGVHHLRKFCGIHPAPDVFGWNNEDITADIVKKDDTVYYRSEMGPNRDKWLEALPYSWLH